MLPHYCQVMRSKLQLIINYVFAQTAPDSWTSFGTDSARSTAAVVAQKNVKQSFHSQFDVLKISKHPLGSSLSFASDSQILYFRNNLISLFALPSALQIWCLNMMCCIGSLCILFWKGLWAEPCSILEKRVGKLWFLFSIRVKTSIFLIDQYEPKNQ